MAVLPGRQHENAISELTNGRLLRGDERTVKAAASDELALRKAFAAEGARGLRPQLLRSNEKLVGNIGEFDVPQLYARLGDRQKALEWLGRNYEEGDPVRRMGLTPSAKGQ